MDWYSIQIIELFVGTATFLFSLYLGLTVYLQNRKSATNQLFLLLSILIDIYIVINYLSLHPLQATAASQLFWIRMVMFVTSFIGPVLLLLVHTFPRPRISMKKNYIISLGLLALFSAGLALTPAVFSELQFINGEPVPVPGLGIFVFLVDFVGLFLLSFIVLIIKLRRAKDAERLQLRLLFGGVLLSFSLMALSTVLFVVFLKTSATVFLGPLFPVILMVFIAYAITKHKLFSAKVIATKILVVTLVVILVSRLLFFSSGPLLFIDAAVLIAVAGFGTLLIRNVRQEITRREQVAKLAHSLEKANVRLKALDRQKTEFLSIASHQLRTPLSIIKGYIELIQDGAYGKVPKKMGKVLKDMNTSNERLVVLVDEFLDITRIEQGRTKYHFEILNINEVIGSVLEDFHEKAKRKGLTIKWAAKKSIKNVYMDEEKIRHVIFNYIDNAIKYSDTGIIRIVLKREDGGVAVHVKDQGFGFNPEDKPNFFHKFYRGKNVEGTNVNGTGLGIYVCKKFVERHGGHVWAHSKGLGKGSEFGFWIPGKKKDTPSAT